MEAKICTDMHNSTMVVVRQDPKQVTKMEEQMLKNQIPGILPVTICYVNQEVVFTYNITRKMTMQEEIRLGKLKGDYIGRRLGQIIQILRESKQYLLEESNFVLDLEQIYLSEGGSRVWLCYLPGYQKKMREQMVGLLEYFMKAIDYADAATVKLVYQLYGISQQETCSFEQLEQPLVNYQEKIDEIQPQEDESLFQKEQTERQEEKIPVLPEKLIEQKEILIYPWQSYVVLGGSAILAIWIFVVLLQTSMFRNPYTRQLDLIKVAGSAVLCVAVLAYVGYRMFQENQKVSRIKEIPSYITYEGKTLKTGEEERSGIRGRHSAIIGSKETGIGEMGTGPESMETGLIGDMDTRMGIHTEEEIYQGVTSRKQIRKDSYDKSRQASDRGIKISDTEAPTQLLNASEEEVATQLLNGTQMLILKPEDALTEPLVINEAECVVGSSLKTADFQVKNPSISRKHIRLRCQMGRYWMEDLSSTNGTFYNGERLASGEEKPLEEGDMIALADQKYQVHYRCYEVV